MKLKLPISALFAMISLMGYNQTKYKWPYLHSAPRYLAVYGGFAGRNLEFKEIGIDINTLHSISSTRLTSPMTGPQITYRSSPQMQAITAGYFMKAIILLGIEYQHRWTLVEKFNSIRPAVGLHLFRCDLEFGYNFFLKKPSTPIANGDFRLGVTIPVIKLKKVKAKKSN